MPNTTGRRNIHIKPRQDAELAKSLKAYRAKHNLRQKDLAPKVGLSTNKLHVLEKGLYGTKTLNAHWNLLVQKLPDAREVFDRVSELVSRPIIDAVQKVVEPSKAYDGIQFVAVQCNDHCKDGGHFMGGLRRSPR